MVHGSRGGLLEESHPPKENRRKEELASKIFSLCDSSQSELGFPTYDVRNKLWNFIIYEKQVFKTTSRPQSWGLNFSNNSITKARIVTK